MKKINEESAPILVQAIRRKAMAVKVKSIEGSTYISHRLSTEAVDKFTGRETGTIGPQNKKKIRVLDEEYESCFYYTDTHKYGIPAAAFMSAFLDAAVACNIPKTQIKRAIRVLGDIYPLKYDKVNRRVDHPKRSGMTGSPDIRHRPEFVNWNTTITIEYDSNQITPEQIMNLINQAGWSCGVGDWRPSAPKSSGTHGMFEVEGKK